MTDLVTSLIEILLLISGSGVVGGVIIFILNWYFYKFPKIEFNLRILDFVFNREITLELEVKNIGDTTASRIICYFAPNWIDSKTINIPDLDPNQKDTRNIAFNTANIHQNISIYISIGYIRKLWKIKMKKVMEVKKTINFSVNHQKSDVIKELLSECYLPLRDLVNRGSDRLSDGTIGLLFKQPTIEAINKIRVKYEYKLNTELIDHLKVIIKAERKGKSRHDGIEMLKIERGHLNDKYKFEKTRDFKAEILRLIDNEIDLLKNELKKAISIE